RRILAAERHELLLVLVLENLEGILIETRHEPVQRICHRYGDQNHVRVHPDVRFGQRRGSFGRLRPRRDIHIFIAGKTLAEQGRGGEQYRDGGPSGSHPVLPFWSESSTRRL